MKSRHTYAWLALEDLAVEPATDVSAALVASVRAFGLLQPVLVTQAGPEGPGKWVVVDGRRRVAAAAASNLARVPAIVAGPQEPGVTAAWRLGCAQGAPLTLDEQVRLYAELVEAGWELPRVVAATGATRSQVATFVSMHRAGGPPAGEVDWVERYAGRDAGTDGIGTRTVVDAATWSVLAGDGEAAAASGTRVAGSARAKVAPPSVGGEAGVDSGELGSWFGPSHPHAAAASALCMHLGHVRGEESVACGLCWEETIIASMSAQSVPRPSRNDVDEAAVSRALSGDTSIELTAAERRRVIWALLDAGWLACDIAAHVGCSTKTVYRATKAKKPAEPPAEE